MGTNRDLYLFIAELGRIHGGTTLSLEKYVKTLRELASADRDADGLTFGRFTALLAQAFEGAPIPYDFEWAADYDSDRASVGGFALWDRSVRHQIVDLHEMESRGVLVDPQRYFGLNSPRGRRWYNFDPLGFLECAVAGTYGGWEPGDDTERDYVPGKVAVMDANGELTSVDPEDVETEIVELGTITWERFADFLWSGQYYE